MEVLQDGSQDLRWKISDSSHVDSDMLFVILDLRLNNVSFAIDLMLNVEKVKQRRTYVY